MGNRVWIELDKPTSPEHADQQCVLANRMLARLTKPEDLSLGARRVFFYSSHERCYCYGGDMGYTTLSDRGEWFDLDYFGRE